MVQVALTAAAVTYAAMTGAQWAASIVAIVIGSAFIIWYTYYARRKPDPIEEARRADMFARGWTPLDEACTSLRRGSPRFPS